MDEKLMFSSDPDALVHMLCEFCGNMCGDTYDSRDNAILTIFLKTAGKPAELLRALGNGDWHSRDAERLTKITTVLNKTMDAFIWRQKHQQALIKEMTAQCDELGEITDRYCNDILEKNDLLALKKMLQRTDINLANTDIFFANEEHKANAENELSEHRENISALLEEYSRLDDGEDPEDETPYEPYVFCRACKGSGIKIFCDVCGGSGADIGGGTCARCSGAGWEDCPECNAEGKLT